MAVRAVPTPSAPPVVGPYSPLVRAGDWLVASGLLGIDPATGALAEGLAAQTRQIFANLAAILADGGAALTDVAKTTVFVTDMATYPEVNGLYAEAFHDHRPARSALGVSELPAGALVEIEVWAYLPES